MKIPATYFRKDLLYLPNKAEGMLLGIRTFYSLYKESEEMGMLVFLHSRSSIKKWAILIAPACPALGLLIVRDRGR
jgi:hypothetical protein